jgi:hypothetical protein
MRKAAIILLTAAGVALLAADLSFEVATVRLNTSGSHARSLGYPPNRFVATNMPLRFRRTDATTWSASPRHTLASALRLAAIQKYERRR